MYSDLIAKILESHNGSLNRIQEHISAIETQRPASREMLVQDQETLLQEYKTRLQDLVLAKEEAIKSYDKDIETCKAAITRLEQEIIDNKAVLEPTTKPRSQKTTQTKITKTRQKKQNP